MADSIKITEFPDIKGAFHCQHKPTSNTNVEKGQAVLCDQCSSQHNAGATLQGDGYGLRQTAFGGWVKSKAAAK